MSSTTHPFAAQAATAPWSTRPLAELMRQIATLVAKLDAQQYTAAPESTRCGAIGGHVRHTIDHLGAWLDGIDGQTINYDNRQRNTDIEHQPAAAIEAIAMQTKRLAGITTEQLAQPVLVKTSLTQCGTLFELPSTHARELAFVFSHTIHHNAIIGAIARAQGLDLPENFGTAPSTIAYRNQGECAP